MPINKLTVAFSGLTVKEEDGLRLRDVQNELKENISDSLLVLGKLKVTLDFVSEQGEFGSINLAPRGLTYTFIRNELYGQRDRPNLPKVRAYVTEPVLELKPYQALKTGPGGQGKNKKKLNKCVNTVYQRIHRCLGMLDVLGQPPVAIANYDSVFEDASDASDDGVSEVTVDDISDVSSDAGRLSEV
ncbi:hypothetical protein BC832DRAFT_588990 [Gaertneriomyces semiglobifer]|nr:hypothetical protein BC832DRAFT_588990 [Gaertneriomyces semiglobifer]